MIEPVFATTSATVTTEAGATLLVRKGTHWPADDPIVRQHPDLFSADARYGMQYTRQPAGFNAPVEQATAAPGEKRQTRRT